MEIMKSKNPMLKIPVINRANKFVIKRGNNKLNYFEISSTIIKAENVLVTEDIQAAQPAMANI